MEFFLGIDGGSTKTKAILINSNGNMVEQWEGAATNPHCIAEQELQSAIFQLLDHFFSIHDQRPDRIYMAVSEVEQDWEKIKIQAILQRYFQQRTLQVPFQIGHEGEPALMAAWGDRKGIVVNCGAGSLIYGCNEQNQVYKLGGWGHLLSDDGSGYRIGLRTLQAAIKSYEGVIPPTRITDALQDMLEIKTMAELKFYVNHMQLSKADIAHFTRICIYAQKSGDQVAKQIIEQCATELAALTSHMLNQDRDFQHCDVAVCGAIFRNTPYYTQCFLSALRKIEKRDVRVTLSPHSSAYGAALLASQINHS